MGNDGNIICTLFTFNTIYESGEPELELLVNRRIMVFPNPLFSPSLSIDEEKWDGGKIPIFCGYALWNRRNNKDKFVIRMFCMLP